MKRTPAKHELAPEAHRTLIATLRSRFEKNMTRHALLAWAEVAAKLDARPEALASLAGMEATGGEPDVVALETGSGGWAFVDCASQSPKGRVSLCYDREALDARKEHKPKGCVTELAASMGVELLTEAEYHALQKLGEFDTKSSSWLRTPPEIRALGGAIFGDRRFGRVFVYHNGAESYYSGRGFRTALRL